MSYSDLQYAAENTRSNNVKFNFLRTVRGQILQRKYMLMVLAYYIWFQCFYNLVAFRTIYPYEDLAELLVSLVENFVPLLLMFIINTATVIYSGTLRIRLWIKIALDFMVSMCGLVMVNFLYLFVASMWIESPSVDWAGTIWNNLTILLINETIYYVRAFKESMLRMDENNRMMLQFRYEALKAKINPHFLFNSLSTLYSLIKVDRDKSLEFTNSLSQVYRQVVAFEERGKVKLSQELKFVEAFVNILKIRYNNHFDVDISGLENVGDKEIIPYSLQILIENVTKHNVIQSSMPMVVTIAIDSKGVRVSNPIRPKNVISDTKIGLSYITELYRRSSKSFVINNDGQTFTAIIPYL